MAKYRRIAIRMWGDEKFKALSRPAPNAQMLWVYLLTGKHTLAVPGLSCVGERGLAEAVGWSLASFRRCFREITNAGMAEADWDNQVLWLPNAAEYNPPENPNVVRAWAKSLEEVPESPLKIKGVRHTLSFLKALKVDKPTAFAEAFIEGLPKDFQEVLIKDFAKQEQEQEQEQNIPPIVPQGTESDEESWSLEESAFEEARKAYPGTKRGHDTEWANFRKKCKDWKELAPALVDAIRLLGESREETKAHGEFVPSWANFQTWINQRKFEECLS